MATCPKCGKPKLPKRRDKLFGCSHCGAVPGVLRAGRSGYIDQDGKFVKFQNGSTIEFMGLK